jgi:tetratricopeptide (TPR) repeat protein
MKPLPSLLTVLTGATAALVIFHPSVAVALSREAIAQIAQSVTVQIGGVGSGSGVIIKRQGDTYTVLSAAHVVETKNNYQVVTADGQKYPVDSKTIKKVPEGVDLAILRFNSPQNYKVVELGDSTTAVTGTPCYVSGLLTASGTDASRHQLSEGQIEAHATHPPASGSALAYSSNNFAGMKGGSILDGQGQLIGIQGQALPQVTATKGSNPETDKKFSLSLAIPLNRFLQLVAQIEPDLDLKDAKAEVVSDLVTVDDLLVQGIEKGIKDDLRGRSVNADRAMQISHHSSFSYFLRGSTRSGSGENKGTIADYDQAIQLNPNFAFAYLNRGLARSELGDKKNAIADYDKAIQLNPNFADAYLNRGITHSELGDKKSAIADYDKAIQLNPNFADAYFNRGITRSDLGDGKGAVADYDQAIRINPNFADAYYNRGAARSDLGDEKSAIADYGQAIRILRSNLNDALTYYNSGLSRAKSGDKKGAIADYDQAIRIYPNFSFSYYNRGNARYTLGDKKGAVADYDRAIRIDPNNALAYGNRGLTRSALGDKKGAIDDLQKTAELFKAQGKTTDYQKAIELLQKLNR